MYVIAIFLFVFGVVLYYYRKEQSRKKFIESEELIEKPCISLLNNRIEEHVRNGNIEEGTYLPYKVKRLCDQLIDSNFDIIADHFTYSALFKGIQKNSTINADTYWAKLCSSIGPNMILRNQYAYILIQQSRFDDAYVLYKDVLECDQYMLNNLLKIAENSSNERIIEITEYFLRTPNQDYVKIAELNTHLRQFETVAQLGMMSWSPLIIYRYALKYIQEQDLKVDLFQFIHVQDQKIAGFYTELLQTQLRQDYRLVIPLFIEQVKAINYKVHFPDIYSLCLIAKQLIHQQELQTLFAWVVHLKHSSASNMGQNQIQINNIERPELLIEIKSHFEINTFFLNGILIELNQNHQYDMALKIYQWMKGNKIRQHRPNTSTYNMIILVFGNLKDYTQGIKLFEEMITSFDKVNAMEVQNVAPITSEDNEKKSSDALARHFCLDVPPCNVNTFISMANMFARMRSYTKVTELITIAREKHSQAKHTLLIQDFDLQKLYNTIIKVLLPVKKQQALKIAIDTYNNRDRKIYHDCLFKTNNKDLLLLQSQLQDLMQESRIKLCTFNTPQNRHHAKTASSFTEAIQEAPLEESPTLKGKVKFS